MAEYEAIELSGLSGPSTVPPQSSSLPLLFSLDPGVPSSRRLLQWAVFATSLTLHVALYLRVHDQVAPTVTRFVQSKVEIELAHAPPEPPEPPKLQEPEPPKEQPVEAARPVPRVSNQAPAPAAQAPVAAADNSNLPTSDEGLLPVTPPGTGAPGPALAPSAPVPAPPVAAPPPPAPVIQAKVGADFARKPGLAYPSLAKREEWEGTVVLRAQILPNGRVSSVSVQSSSGHSVLDDAALAAAKAWSFVPATQGGQPVAGTVTFPVQFKLE